LRLLRACWTGTPTPGPYGDIDLPDGVQCRPAPVHGTVPILVGGNSRAALRRAAVHGDGWLGAVPLDGLPAHELRTLVILLRQECERAGREASTMDMTLRIAPHPRTLGTPELAELLLEYAAAGITRFLFDVGWRDLDTAKRRLAALAVTTTAVREGTTVSAS
jgi:alkanesulfonate monooxygenase SsuD/methylene tetrahydromethanopterin reductase-like flavin-dependent oxidoreductase (luciferase family)